MAELQNTYSVLFDEAGPAFVINETRRCNPDSELTQEVEAVLGQFAVGFFTVGYFAVRALFRKEISLWDISPYF